MPFANELTIQSGYKNMGFSGLNLFSIIKDEGS